MTRVLAAIGALWLAALGAALALRVVRMGALRRAVEEG